MLEKLVHDRLFSYLMDNDILTDRQGGFRPGNSTTITASAFITHVMEAYNVGQFTSTVFVDLRKAFDTIDHTILLTKLNLYGIRNLAHDWLTSYQTARSQRVMAKGRYSDYRNVTHGVPQGSVLGPVLFLLYITDVVNSISTDAVYLCG